MTVTPDAQNIIDKKITLRYFFLLVVAVLVTWVVHEFAHWLTSESFGYETIMSLNGTSAVKGQNPTEWHKIIISAAGPFITILQGLIAFLLLRRSWNKYLYSFLFVAFYMRLAAGLMNFKVLNDEGRISAFLKIGTFTLPIIVSGFLFFMVYNISKKYQLDWKFQTATTLIVIILSSMLILSDMYFKIRIL